MRSVKILLLILSLAFFKSPVSAQKLTPNYSVHKILRDYLYIKNALVNNEGTAAKLKANELYVFLTEQPYKGLTNEQWKLLANYLEPLIENSGSIAETGSLDKQRPYFAKLSITMYELIKRSKINTSTIYEQYCPMNNLYWLSETRTITNPYYYSKDMISNGKIAATLEPVK